MKEPCATPFCQLRVASTNTALACRSTASHECGEPHFCALQRVPCNGEARVIVSSPRPLTTPATQQLAQAHFESPVEFLDLFLPVNISSASRAKAFLWLMFHYLSAPDKPNPFDDDTSREHPGRVPGLLSLSREDMQRENQDPQDEIEWGRRMSQQRSKFLKELVDEMEADKRRKKNAQLVPPVSSQFSTSMYSGWQGFPFVSISPLNTHLTVTGDITSGRTPRGQRAGTSTDEGSRGSSYGHELPPPNQGIQQPAPRLPQAPQGHGKYPHFNAPDTGNLTAVCQLQAATKSSRKIALCYSVRQNFQASSVDSLADRRHSIFRCLACRQ